MIVQRRRRHSRQWCAVASSRRKAIAPVAIGSSLSYATFVSCWQRRRRRGERLVIARRLLLLLAGESSPLASLNPFNGHCATWQVSTVYSQLVLTPTDAQIACQFGLRGLMHALAYGHHCMAIDSIDNDEPLMHMLAQWQRSEVR